MGGLTFQRNARVGYERRRRAVCLAAYKFRPPRFFNVRLNLRTRALTVFRPHRNAAFATGNRTRDLELGSRTPYPQIAWRISVSRNCIGISVCSH